MPGGLFVAEAVAATAAVDAIMAEAWSFAPFMRAADRTAGEVADPSRAAGAVNAIFLDKTAKPELPRSYDPREQRRPGLESGTPRLKISAHELVRQRAADAAFEVRACDRFTRAADGVTWRVSSVEPLAGGSLLATINVLG